MVAMVELAGLIRRSQGLWCIDNVAELMSLVKGSSGTESLDGMAKVVHLGAFALEAVAYYEYVESKANWSDEISRMGTRGNWARRNGFAVSDCGVATILLHLPCLAIAKVFAYL